MKRMLLGLALASAAFPPVAMASTSAQQADTVVKQAETKVASSLMKQTKLDGPRLYIDPNCFASGTRFHCGTLMEINYTDGHSAVSCAGLDWVARRKGKLAVTEVTDWSCYSIPDWTLGS